MKRSIMKQILCYGDSNTWGFMPRKDKPPVKAANRFAWEVRWPGLLQKNLGPDYHVIEEGLNGRTTMFDCFMEEHRNGLKDIDVSLLTHMPIDLVILMLGTNDCKEVFGKRPVIIAHGMQRLIDRVKGGSYGYGPEGNCPEILVTAPIRMGEGVFTSWLSPEFDEQSLERDRNLAQYYQQVAENNGVHFLNAGAYIQADAADGIHMNADGHRKMAELMENEVRRILG